MKRLLPVSCICGLLLLTGSRLGAQTPAPPSPAPVPATPATPAVPAATQVPQALVELRGRHFQNLEKAEEAVARRELEAMGALEKERAEKGDYAGAERAARRVDELKKALEKPGAGKAGVIRLTGLDNPKSNFGVESKTSGAIKLGKTDSFVQWDVGSIKPGFYEVIVHYTANLAELGGRAGAQRVAAGYTGTVGGEVEFSQASSLATGEKKVKRVSPTASDKPEALSLGVIELTGTSANLRLRAALANPDGLMMLHSLELSPATPSGKDVEPPELTQAKALYRKELNPKLKPLHEAWVVRLRSLEKEYGEAGKTAEREAALKELDRMKQYSGGSPSAPDSGSDKPVQPFVLSATDALVATTSGEIRPTERNKWLHRLRPANARITFGLDRANPKVPAGNYKVSAAIRTGPTSGGEYQFKCGPSVLSGSVGASETPQEHTLEVPGVLVVGPTDRSLTFTVQSLKNADGSLCEFASVTLTPTSSGPPKTEPGAGGASEAPKAKAEL